MKSFQLILTLFVASTFHTNGLEWAPGGVDVETPADQNAGVHPPNALRRMQATTDLLSTESGSFGSVTDATASATDLTTETEAPTTIMVLLPDILAPSFSGSGSVMFFDGEVGKENKNETKSADPDTGVSSAIPIKMTAALTAFTILFAYGML